ncbi:hypothetical protein [Sulfitobacter sp. M23508]|uniref:hypothetical protein n=1 Tax=Sulfitobacter sp. M23508 TaxID=3368577 RepID=UPI0037475566
MIPLRKEDIITLSQPSREVQRQKTEPRKMLTPQMFVAGLALSVAALIGGAVASKGISNLAKFNATPFTIRGAY